MRRPHPRRGCKPAVLLIALLSCLGPRPGLAALAPAQSEEPPLARASGAGQPQQEPGLYELIPVRWRGSVNFAWRHDSGDGGSSSQRSLGAVLSARTDLPVWQPWFGKVTGSLDFNLLRDRFRLDDQTDAVGGSYNFDRRSVILSGQGQLSLFPFSRFPFEAHFNRSDSRTAVTLSALDGYSSERLGFTQNYRWGQGNVMFGWDRNRQTSLQSDEYRQNTLQLQFAQNISPDQHFTFSGSGTRNSHENTGELSQLERLYAQHTLRSGDALTLENSADISRSRYRTGSAAAMRTQWQSRLVQLNSFGAWKPTDQPLTVTGGLRIMDNSNSWGTDGLDASASAARWKSLNVNAGATYSVTRALQVSASGNVNFNDGAGQQVTSSIQTAGLVYTPEPISLGPFQYMWNGETGLANRTGANDAGRMMRGQLSHVLSRSITMGQGSVVTAQATQTLGARNDTREGSRRELTHTGLVSWSASQESSSELLQINGSDRRNWGTNPSYFQLVNAQATGTLNSGRHTSWSGNLTIQATRQRYGLAFDATRPDTLVVLDTGGKFVPTSSGSMTYTNRRAFGVSRLLFVSELRLNSQALLPLVGGPLDQERTSWENRFEYTFGRVFVRFNTRLSKVGGRANKAILMTVTRSFGD